MLVVDYNENGRDFIIGDLHGCRSLLDKKLKDVNFNTKTDRLFSTGDLVDRGEESLEAAELLYEPWFFAVRGNHEQMAIDAAHGFYSRENYIANGGEWFLKIGHAMQQELAEKFSAMPLTISLYNTFGIVHGDCMYDWIKFNEALDKGEIAAVHSALWGRQRIRKTDTTPPVENIFRVYCGHTPVKEVTYKENVVYIDTGAVFSGGHLSLLQLR